MTTTTFRHAEFCTFSSCHPDDHGPYCQRIVGRAVTAHGADGAEIEVRLAVASPVAEQATPVQPTVIQLTAWLPDGTDVVLDVPVGEWRSLLAIGGRAADIADSVR